MKMDKAKGTLIALAAAGLFAGCADKAAARAGGSCPVAAAGKSSGQADSCKAQCTKTPPDSGNNCGGPNGCGAPEK